MARSFGNNWIIWSCLSLKSPRHCIQALQIHHPCPLINKTQNTSRNSARPRRTSYWTCHPELWSPARPAHQAQREAEDQGAAAEGAPTVQVRGCQALALALGGSIALHLVCVGCGLHMKVRESAGIGFHLLPCGSQG